MILEVCSWGFETENPELFDVHFLNVFTKIFQKQNLKLAQKILKKFVSRNF